MPFATLPMYDMAPLRPAWEALWKKVREDLAELKIDVEPTLKWPDEPYVAWKDKALLIGQTCGWPLVSALQGKVVPFARFDFGLSETPPGDYRSVFIARQAIKADGPLELEPLFHDRSVRIAVNGTDSQSGFRALGECLSRPLKLKPDRAIVTGSHAASIHAVADGKADLAAVDAVTWRYAKEHQPATKRVHVIAHSRSIPGLPLVTSPAFADSADAMRKALRNAINRLDGETRKVLGIREIMPSRLMDYAVLLDQPFGRFNIA